MRVRQRLARLTGIAMAVAAVAATASQFGEKIDEQMEKQWRGDPVACLEALRELAKNSQATAIARLELKLNPRQRELYQAGLNLSPRNFWEALMTSRSNCDVEKIRPQVEKQLVTHPESLRQFLQMTDSAGARRCIPARTPWQSRAFFELAWPMRSDAGTVNAYLACRRDPSFIRYVDSLFCEANHD